MQDKALAYSMATPNEKQKLFLLSEKKYIAYGGARGGGKSWAVQKKAALLAFHYGGIRVLLLRHTYGEVYKNHVLPLMSDMQGFIKAGVVSYSKSDNAFAFKNGSRIECGYLENDKDLLRYQGIEYDVMFIDEATQISEYQYVTLLASLRGANSYPKRCYITCNPGGVGHAWVKRLFVDKFYKPEENPEDYDFISATVYDNPAMLEKDPDYVKRLEQLPPGKKEAWLEGRWDVFEGQYFPEFTRGVHTCAPFELPAHWRRYFALDYGLDMFAGYWAAMDEKGDCWVYREAYQSGLLMGDAARMAREMSGGEYLEACFAPRDLWNQQRDTGLSVADSFAQNGFYLIEASNNRAMGWLNVKEWLKIREDGTPRLHIFETCKNLIESFPYLLYDPKNPNDVSGEPHQFSHGPDALRYLLAGRPQAAEKPGGKALDDEDNMDSYEAFLNFGR